MCSDVVARLKALGPKIGEPYLHKRLRACNLVVGHISVLTCKETASDLTIVSPYHIGQIIAPFPKCVCR
jgi:hypothetical protein